MPKTNLTDEVGQRIDSLVDLRRDIHRHPELGFAENRTAGLAAERMRRAGLEVKTGVAKTGVIGLLEGGHPGKTLLIRADMDALPLPEERDTPYRSEVENVMHACGHDGHVAMAVVAAEVLAGMRDELHGSVKFCFQPAEEGPGGAQPMIEQGVLRDPTVDAAIGIHLWNALDVGQVGVGNGVATCAAR